MQINLVRTEYLTPKSIEVEKIIEEVDKANSDKEVVKIFTLLMNKYRESKKTGLNIEIECDELLNKIENKNTLEFVLNLRCYVEYIDQDFEKGEFERFIFFQGLNKNGKVFVFRLGNDFRDYLKI